MAELTKERLIAYLKDLDQITRKHRIEIVCTRDEGLLLDNVFDFKGWSCAMNGEGFSDGLGSGFYDRLCGNGIIKGSKS